MTHADAVLHTPVSSLENTLDFYTRLGFTRLSETPLLFSDGKALVEINPDLLARADMKLYKDSWSAELTKLDGLVNIIQTEEGVMFSDPSGSWVYLSTRPAPGVPDRTGEHYGVLGNYVGMYLETGDIQRSRKIYEALGFAREPDAPPTGYIPMSRGSFQLTIMPPRDCPHLFFNPSMCYFNGKNNINVIARIREQGVPIAQEITHFNKEGIVDNVILRDPGGYGFFVFSD